MVRTARCKTKKFTDDGLCGLQRANESARVVVSGVRFNSAQPFWTAFSNSKHTGAGVAGVRGSRLAHSEID